MLVSYSRLLFNYSREVPIRLNQFYRHTYVVATPFFAAAIVEDKRNAAQE
jgi:hypothetical protein